MADIQVITTVDGLLDFRNVWNSWSKHPNSHIDVYLNTIRARTGTLHPFVLVVTENRKPDALLLGRMDRQQPDVRIGYKKCWSPRLRMLTFVYQGFLGNQSDRNCQLILAEILRRLRIGEADVAYFNQLERDCPLYTLLRSAPKLMERDWFPQEQVHRSLQLFDSDDRVYKHLSSKVRKNLRWQARKLHDDQDDQIEIRCYRRSADVDEMTDHVEAIAKGTYHRALGIGFQLNDQTRTRLELEAEMGWLRAFVLLVKGTPRAFWLGSSVANVFHSNFMGYDASMARYSPGMYLITKAIEQLQCESDSSKVSVVDFGFGDAQYKLVLGNRECTEVSAFLFGRTLLGVAFNVIRFVVCFLDRAARVVLESTGVTQRIKKIWRVRVSSSGAMTAGVNRDEQ